MSHYNLFSEVTNEDFSNAVHESINLLTTNNNDDSVQNSDQDPKIQDQELLETASNQNSDQ